MKKKRFWLWFSSASILFLFLCMFMGINGEYSNSPTELDRPDEIEAITMAQYFVKERLLSPHSADFPWSGWTVVPDMTGNRFKIESYVDSQNAFGAMIRTQYWCVVQYEPNYKNRTLESLSFR